MPSGFSGAPGLPLSSDPDIVIEADSSNRILVREAIASVSDEAQGQVSVRWGLTAVGSRMKSGRRVMRSCLAEEDWQRCVVGEEAVEGKERMLLTQARTQAGAAKWQALR